MYWHVVDQPYHSQDAGKGLSLPYDLATVCSLAIWKVGNQTLYYRASSVNDSQLNVFTDFNTSNSVPKYVQSISYEYLRDPNDTDQERTCTILV